MDYIKCELIGGGSPKHLNTLQTVAVVDCTHVHHVVHYKIIRTYHTLLLLLTAPI